MAKSIIQNKIIIIRINHLVYAIEYIKVQFIKLVSQVKESIYVVCIKMLSSFFFIIYSSGELIPVR